MDDTHVYFLYLGLVLLIYGLYLIWSAYKTHQLFIASQGWPVTQGKVVKNFIQEIHYEYLPFIPCIYLPQATYLYTAGGEEYTRSIKLLFLTLSAKKAARFTEKFPTGADILVRYNPIKPQESLVQYDREEFPWGGVLLIIVGSLLVLWNSNEQVRTLLFSILDQASR